MNSKSLYSNLPWIPLQNEQGDFNVADVPGPMGFLSDINTYECDLGTLRKVWIE